MIGNDALGQVIDMLAPLPAGRHDYPGMPQCPQHLLRYAWPEPVVLPFLPALLKLALLRHEGTAICDLLQNLVHCVFMILKDLLLEPAPVDGVNVPSQWPALEGHQRGHLVPPVIHQAFVVRDLLPVAHFVARHASLEHEIVVAPDRRDRIELYAPQTLERPPLGRAKRKMMP